MKQILIYRERLNKTAVVQLLSKLVPMHLVLSLALLFSLVSGASAFYLASSTKRQPDSGIEQKIITAYKADPLAFAEFRAGPGNSDRWIKDDSSAFWANNVGQERRNHESQTTQKPLARL